MSRDGSRPPVPARGTEDLDSGSRDAALVPSRVEAVLGPARGVTRVLARGTISVGSGADCDLVLADPSVSRRHLEVQLLPGAVKVRDLGSRNGTLYLGARIEQATVPLGGSVQVGRTTLRFSPDEAPRPVAARDAFFGLLGGSEPMRRLYDTLERLAPLDVPVLVVGETGAGKDAAARALHAASPRAKRPLAVFDCAAVGRELFESALFGHAKGAFTGAGAAHAGALDAALDGTLFLDGVGEIPLEQQTRLLRALEAREFKRVGDNAVRVLRARVVSATHRDLEAEVRAGRFREDLYFRLAVARVDVPPLRARLEDIPVLAAAFAREMSGEGVALEASTIAALRCDPWPGNVRELRSAVTRALALGRPLQPAPKQVDPASFHQAREALLDAFERDYLASLLARHSGNVSAAARSSKLSRRQLYRLLDKHGLGSDDPADA